MNVEHTREFRFTEQDFQRIELANRKAEIRSLLKFERKARASYCFNNLNKEKVNPLPERVPMDARKLLIISVP